MALRSQGIEVPILVTAPEGMEADAIQAFRLGARDYLVKPLREAEVVAAAERALNEVRLRHEREQLAKKLAESNRELERRVAELTTLYGLGKAVTSTTQQSTLFSKLMQGSLYVTEADIGWILLREDESRKLILRAQQDLPPALAVKLHHPWEDGVSSLVMLSGESLRIHGEGLAKFKLAQFSKSALIIPIKVRNRPIGVISVARREGRPFTDRHQAMLEAVADYASISLVNARLFQALEARAKQLQQQVERTRTGAGLSAEKTYELEETLRASQSVLERSGGKNQEAEFRDALKSVVDRLAALLESVHEATGGVPEDITPGDSPPEI